MDTTCSRDEVCPQKNENIIDFDRERFVLRLYTLIIIIFSCMSYLSFWRSCLVLGGILSSNFSFRSTKVSGSLFIFMIERGLCFGCIAEANIRLLYSRRTDTSIDFHFDMSLI